MKFSSAGVAATGATTVAVDGVVPTNLVGVTAGNPHWLDAGTLIFQYEVTPSVFGLGTLDPPSGAIVNLDSLGANALAAGGNVWAAYLSVSGVRTNVAGLGPFPLAAVGDLDDLGRSVIVTQQSTGTGLQAFSSAGVQTWATAATLTNANVRAWSNVVAYQDAAGWHLVQLSTGAALPLAQRTATVTLMIPVVLGSATYVVEYATDIGISVRLATQSQGYLIPDTIEQMFNPDAVGISGTTVRVGGCVASGEAPTELRTFDINVVSGAFRSGVTTSGSLVWTTEPNLTAQSLPATGGGTSVQLTESLYQQPIVDPQARGRVSKPWYRFFESVAKAGNTAINFNADSFTGILQPAHGGTGVTTGLTTLLPPWVKFSDESLLLGRGEGNGAGDGQEISLGAGLEMVGTTLQATGAGTGYWTILTNGDPVMPEVVFDSNGDAIAVFVP